MRVDGNGSLMSLGGTLEGAEGVGSGDRLATAGGAGGTDAAAAVDVRALIQWLADSFGWGRDGVDPPSVVPPFADVPPGSVEGPASTPSGGALTPQQQILAGARELYDSPDMRVAFARASRYLSLNPEITGQYGGQSKDNVFAGDVLHKAGFDVPTYTTKGWDGAEGKHYMSAERWPQQTAFFDKITDLQQVQPGDVLIADHLGRRGASGAVAEVITGVRLDGDGHPIFTTMGARTNGLVEDEKQGKKLAAAQPDGDHFLLDLPERAGQRTGDTAFYILRPTKPLAA